MLCFVPKPTAVFSSLVFFSQLQRESFSPSPDLCNVTAKLQLIFIFLYFIT